MFCQLVHAHKNIAKKSLVQLSILMCHKFPRVRKITVSRLYETLVLYSDGDVVPVENVEEAMSILCESNWDMDLGILREVRNNLCMLMDVKTPVKKVISSR